MRPMPRTRALVLAAILALLASLNQPASASATSTASFIVLLRPGVDASVEAPRLARIAGGELGHVYRHALNGFQLTASANAAAALRRSPRVASVHPDHPIQLSETLPNGVKRIDGFVPGGDGAYQAGHRGAGARIAVLDTGIDLDHPDLVGAVDSGLGRNCLNETIPPNDGYGHGTHVAGTAAAPLNGTGVVGVAPEARLVAVKMFDDAGNSAESLALCALDHVVRLNTDATADNDVDVVNMSWGEQRSWGDCASDPLHRAICAAHAAGMILVAGAGNSAVNAGSFVPAAYPEVISVSALADFDGNPGGSAGCGFVQDLFWIECDDTFAFFSNYGASVDVIAPGVMVYSTWAGAGYRTSSGTSMAAPHVAGVAALMAAADPSITTDEARAALLLSGECPNGQWADADLLSGCAGQGSWPDDPDGIPEVLVNALRAAESVAGEPPPPPPPPPDPTEPGAPVLTAATGGVDSITLSWSVPSSDGGSPITGYEVWRGTSPGSTSPLATLGVQTGYVDTAVVAGTTYWYEVVAVNLVGSGPASNQLSAALIRAPSAPTLLGAPADGAAALSWTVPADDGGSPITGYALYRSVSDGPEVLHATTDAGETTYVDFGLANGTSYTYRVAALNAAGEGALSNAVTVTPGPDATVPDAPQDLSGVKAKGNTVAIELSWTAPASDGGSPIATYFVYRRAPGESGFSFLGTTPNGTTTQFSDTSVDRRTSYTYRVTAWNAYGEGPPSNEVSVRSR